MSELKPCPFCGEPADDPDAGYWSPEGERSEWYVMCSRCPAEITGQGTRADTVAAWNRRPDRLTQESPTKLRDGDASLGAEAMAREVEALSFKLAQVRAEGYDQGRKDQHGWTAEACRSAWDSGKNDMRVGKAIIAILDAPPPEAPDAE